MLQKAIARWWRITAGLLLALLPISPLAAAADTATNSWTSPAQVVVQRVGTAPAIASQPVFQSNLDCTPLTYRLNGTNNGLEQGCFTQTAFGMFSADRNVMFINGADEAVPVKGLHNNTLTPIPGAVAMGSLTTAPAWGSYLNLYTYFPNSLKTFTDILLRPYKQVVTAANLTFTDPANQPIAINPQTMAYSAGNSWMVVEAPLRSFMRVNMATFDIVPFATPFTNQAFDLSLHNSQVAVSDSGQYAAIQSNEFKSFKIYDLGACKGTVQSTLKPLNCASHEYWADVSKQIKGLQRVSHVRFLNENILSFNATYDDGSGGKTDNFELSPTGSISSLIDYLGLGDSYSSGEGAFNYVPGTDTSNDKCHLSGHSYPLLLSGDIFSATSGHSVACSGAKIQDIMNTSQRYAGQVKDGVPQSDRDMETLISRFLPGYIAQINFPKRYQPQIMTVGIGGNDVGFADIIASCVKLHVGVNTCYASYEDRLELENSINNLFPKLTGLYRQLQDVSPDSHIYAVGYPEIAASDGSCALNVHLDAQEILFSQQLVHYLNNVIEKSAHSVGIGYVDITHALDGHRLCEAGHESVAVNGLTAGDDIVSILGKESYHPNALGHELIEQAILRATHNFTASIPAADPSIPQPTSSPSDPMLAGAPKTGRTIFSAHYDDSATLDGLVRGATNTLTVDGLRNGLQPDTQYALSLHSTPISLGTVTTDGFGNITTTFSIPNDVEPGFHTLHITGVDLVGQPIDILKTVYIAGAANDSCSAAWGSGQDTDQDGVDDACDGFIGLAPPSSPPPTDTSSDSSAATATLPASSPLEKITSSAASPVLAVSSSNPLAIVLTDGDSTSTSGVLGITTPTISTPKRATLATAPRATVAAVQPLRPWLVGLFALATVFVLAFVAKRI